jgi:hypothetical protein
MSSLKTNSNLLTLTPLDVGLRKLKKKRRQREEEVQTSDGGEWEEVFQTHDGSGSEWQIPGADNPSTRG